LLGQVACFWHRKVSWTLAAKLELDPAVREAVQRRSCSAAAAYDQPLLYAVEGY